MITLADNSKAREVLGWEPRISLKNAIKDLKKFHGLGDEQVIIPDNEKPRVLIFSIAYEPLIGGAELAVRYITDRLLSYEFDLVTCRFDSKHKPEEQIGNVHVYRIGFGNRLGRYLYPIQAASFAKKLQHKKNYSMVWSIMAAYASAAALLFLKSFPKVKFLLTLQEGDTIEHIHKQVRGFRGKWQEIFKRADHIQAISRFLADWARSEGAVCPIEVVPNGVDLEKFRNQPRRKVGAPTAASENSKFVIITTSRLVLKNGIDTLIKAAAELKFHIPHSTFHIQILGSGPEEENLKKLARDLKLDDLVQFYGSIEPDKIPEYLSQADIFVRPSRSEGLGTSFLEAMAAGLPVVGTPVGGIPDFLIDGVNGLFCKPEDPKDLSAKIKQLITDDELRNRLSQNGQRSILEKYGWDGIAQQMDAIFSKLV